MSEVAHPALDRVSADGFYVCDPNLPGAAFRSQWIGDGVRGADGNTHYKTLRLRAGFTVKVGDFVAVVPHEAMEGDVYELVHIMDMWQVSGGKRIQMRFFYHFAHFDADDANAAANSLAEREVLWSSNVGVFKPGVIEGCVLRSLPRLCHTWTVASERSLCIDVLSRLWTADM